MDGGDTCTHNMNGLNATELCSKNGYDDELCLLLQFKKQLHDF